jgi:hypothetical protein
MNSFMNMVKIQNPEKEYPSNMGNKWSDEEETLLLEELNKNIDIETISQTHNRTIGGINSRRRKIAYNMYLKNDSMKEIINQTKLDDECIRQTIERRQNNNSKKITKIKTLLPATGQRNLHPSGRPLLYQPEHQLANSVWSQQPQISIESEIAEMKNEIKDLKNTIKELVNMMKAVYEFEDV